MANKSIILRREDSSGEGTRVFLDLKDGESTITAAMVADLDHDGSVDRISLVGDLDGDNDLDEDDKTLLRDMVTLFLKIKW